MDIQIWRILKQSHLSEHVYQIQTMETVNCSQTPPSLGGHK